MQNIFFSLLVCWSTKHDLSAFSIPLCLLLTSLFHWQTRPLLDEFSQRFFWLLSFFSPGTVIGRKLFSSPEDLVLWHWSLSLCFYFTIVTSWLNCHYDPVLNFLICGIVIVGESILISWLGSSSVILQVDLVE